jgi:pyridoxal phosphate-dependent aminotransferase EpsN
MGDAGVFSFNGNKIITCSGGGMLVSPNQKWVDKARFWSAQACDPGACYLHSELGYNYRLSNLLGGIARAQLKVLDERVAKRREIAFRYRDGLADIPGIQLMPQAAYGLHTNWLSCFTIIPKEFGMDQLGLLRFLDQANIESRPVWKPMHTQKLYLGYECVGGDVALDIHRHGICLPSSSSLTLEDQNFVINRICEAHQSALRNRRVFVTDSIVRREQGTATSPAS